MQTRPMQTYRGTPSFTTFDPITHTPGTRDYVSRAGVYRGQARDSVVGVGRGYARSYSAAALPSFNLIPGVVVPSLPRRSYIPTVGANNY